MVLVMQSNVKIKELGLEVRQYMYAEKLMLAWCRASKKSKGDEEVLINISKGGEDVTITWKKILATSTACLSTPKQGSACNIL